MKKKIKVLQVIPKLGYGGAETGCYDLAHFLPEKNCKSLYIPAGFAHGFCSLDKENLVLYGLTKYRSKKDEVGILWDDNHLKIKWPIKKPTISFKDKNNLTFKKYLNKKI